jgi:hypothetical protein
VTIGDAVDVGGTTATAAKLAEEVSADIVTGGIVAESEPPPDFSCWTVEDDILLKNAMEVLALFSLIIACFVHCFGLLKDKYIFFLCGAPLFRKKERLNE